jgi:hypothetical protein
MKAWCLAKVMNENFLEPPLAKTQDFCALSFPFWLSDSVLQSGHTCIQNGTSEECLDVRLRENRTARGPQIPRSGKLNFPAASKDAENSLRHRAGDRPLTRSVLCDGDTLLNRHGEGIPERRFCGIKVFVKPSLAIFWLTILVV